MTGLLFVDRRGSCLRLYSVGVGGSAMQAFEVGNDKVALRFAVSRAEQGPLNPFPWKGIRLESIHDLDAGREFLESPTDLFEYALNNGSARSSRGLDVTGAVVTDGGRAVRFEARDSTQHLLFDIDVRTDGDQPAVVVRLTISVLGDDSALRPSAFLRMVYP